MLSHLRHTAALQGGSGRSWDELPIVEKEADRKAKEPVRIHSAGKYELELELRSSDFQVCGLCTMPR